MLYRSRSARIPQNKVKMLREASSCDPLAHWGTTLQERARRSTESESWRLRHSKCAFLDGSLADSGPTPGHLAARKTSRKVSRCSMAHPPITHSHPASTKKARIQWLARANRLFRQLGSLMLDSQRDPRKTFRQNLSTHQQTRTLRVLPLLYSLKRHTKTRPLVERLHWRRRSGSKRGFSYAERGADVRRHGRRHT